MTSQRWMLAFCFALASVLGTGESVTTTETQKYTCRTFGSGVVQPFNGSSYYVRSNCPFTLTRFTHNRVECDITVRRGDNGLLVQVEIIINKVRTVVQNGNILVEKKSVSLPYDHTYQHIFHYGIYTKLKSSLLPLSVIWHHLPGGIDTMWVELEQELSTDMTGLCGKHNVSGNGQQLVTESMLADETCRTRDLVSAVNPTCRIFFSYTLDCLRDRTPRLMQLCEENIYLYETSGYIGCAFFKEVVRQCGNESYAWNVWRTLTKCEEPTCPGDLVYVEQGPPFVPSCSNPYPTFSNQELTSSCVCTKDEVLNDRADGFHCVNVSSCPCVFAGRSYSTGDIRSTKCQSCMCDSGKWRCSENLCPTRCLIEGQFVATFDGKQYVVPGKCTYVASQGLNWTITIEFSAKAPSLTKVILQLFQDSYTFSHNRVTFGEEDIYELHESDHALVFWQSSLYVQVHTSFGMKIQVQMSPEIQLYITPPRNHIGMISGLCGNSNNDTTDDFTTSSGIIENSAQPFAQSWSVGACPVNIPPTCINTDNEIFAEEMCSVLNNPTGIFAKCHGLIPTDHYHTACIQRTCNCGNSPPQCLCVALGSYAKACASLGVVIGDWRKATNCTLTCQNNQEFSYNMQACNHTCRSLSGPDPTCGLDDAPVEGCGCPEGTHLIHGHCVPKSECGCHYHGGITAPGSVIMDGRKCICENGELHCSPDCGCSNGKVCFHCSEYPVNTAQKTCDSLSKPMVTNTTCESGCYCPHDQYEDHRGNCVPLDNCTCVYSGKVFSAGQHVKTNCKTCICGQGQWHCRDEPCPGKCQVYGNGHYQTFDSKWYSFDGQCQYTLVENGCGNRNGTFSVRVESVPCCDEALTCSRSIILDLQGEVTLTLSDMKVTRRHHKGWTLQESPLYSTHTVGLYIIISVPSRGITLIWDKHTRITIELQAYWRNRVCGLCGNFDSNEMNDLQISGSAVESSPLAFGNSWKAATPPCSDVTTEIFPCERNSYCSAWAQRRCMILTGDTFNDCHLKVDPDPYYHACVQESCSCEFEGKFLGFCTAVAAYAEACSEQDVCVKWRTPDMCPVYCDYYNEQGQCSWHYEACGETLTCGKDNYVTLKLEGCYPRCSKEAPYYDENTGECTKLRNCTCYFNDTIIQPWAVVMIQSTECRCENGTMNCQRVFKTPDLYSTSAPTAPAPTTTLAPTSSPPTTAASTTTETTVLSTTTTPTTTETTMLYTTTTPTTTETSSTTTSTPITTIPNVSTTTENWSTVLSTTATPTTATTLTTAEKSSTAPPTTSTLMTTITNVSTTTENWSTVLSTTSTPTTTTTLTTAETLPTAPPTTSTPMTTITNVSTSTENWSTVLSTTTPTTTTSLTTTETLPTAPSTTSTPMTTIPNVSTTTENWSTVVSTTSTPTTTLTTAETSSTALPTTSTPMTTTTNVSTTTENWSTVLSTTATPRTRTTLTTAETSSTMPLTTSTPMTTIPNVSTTTENWSTVLSTTTPTTTTSLTTAETSSTAPPTTSTPMTTIPNVSTTTENWSTVLSTTSTPTTPTTLTTSETLPTAPPTTSTPMTTITNVSTTTENWSTVLSTTSTPTTTTTLTTAETLPTAPPTTSTPMTTITNVSTSTENWSTVLSTTTPTTTTSLTTTETLPTAPSTTSTLMTTIPNVSTTTENWSTVVSTTSTPTTTLTTAETSSTALPTTSTPMTTTTNVSTTTENWSTVLSTTATPTTATTLTTAETSSTMPLATSTPMTTIPNVSTTTENWSTVLSSTTPTATTSLTTAETSSTAPPTISTPMTTIPNVSTTTENWSTVLSTTSTPTTTTTLTTSETLPTAPPTTSTPMTTITNVSTTTENWSTVLSTTSTPTTTTTLTTAETLPTVPPTTSTPMTTIINVSTTTENWSTVLSTTTPTTTTSLTTIETLPTAPSTTSTTKACECTDLKRRKRWDCGETWTEDCFHKNCTDGKIELTSVVCPEPTIPNCPRDQATKVSDGCCETWKCDCRCDLFGDPHYISFQGVTFDFLDECTYILVEERSPRHHLTIAVDNIDCVPGLEGSCAKGIILKYQDNIATLRILPRLFGIQATLNSVTIEPPYEEHGFRFETTRYIVSIYLPEVRSYVSLSPSYTLVVSLAMEYFLNNTQGQCGVCGVASCIRKGGQIEDDSCCDKTAYDWVYPDPLKPACASAPRDVPCYSTTTEPSYTTTTTTCPASSLCELLDHPVFSNCSRYVNLTLKKKNCEFDSCRNGPCSTLEQAAEECMNAGVCVDWRALTNGSCNVTCADGLVYRECRDKLDDFCSGGMRHQGASLENSREGCFCPSGFFRAGNHSHICVSDCPCCKGPLGEPRMGGEVWQSGCHQCTCNNKTHTEECVPKPPEPAPLCSPTAVLVKTSMYTSCCVDQICVEKTCSYRGKTYKVGDRWKDAVHPCMSLSCSKEGIQTETRVCPKEDCQEEDRIWDDQHCCFTCNQSCAPKVTAVNVTVKNCTAVMQIPVCQGQCVSQPRVVLHGYLVVKQKFSCCQERSSERRPVTLQCFDLSTRQYHYKHITSCECTACSMFPTGVLQ